MMITGPVMMDLEGLVVNAEEKEILNHPHIGGVILFTRNFTDLEQLNALICEIRSIKKKSLLIAVDHEGGRVQRFRETFTQLPPMQLLGKLYDESPDKGIFAAQSVGFLMGAELLANEIDLSFAPVLDLNYGVSQVIGDRSFHHSIGPVSALGCALMQGLKKAGMAAVAKHFPGHGAVEADSHIAIPYDDRELADIEAADIQPFIHLINHGLSGVMPAHVIYRKVDSVPAGFSELWLQKILRHQLGFQGAIFSDDLTMQGASIIGDYLDRANLALNAGCDMLLVCNNRKAVISILDNLKFQLSSLSQQRLTALKGRVPEMSFDDLQRTSLWRDARNLVGSLQ